ncbi:MAG: DUF3656 domain-containing protein [Bacillota bacterium]|nr:DUF3656 domain-containing protein [Bacillota bacterium]
MNEIELLAPAGEITCVYAAVQNGADSVYLGLKDFGARGYAENFDERSLHEVVDYCHMRGVKVYITLNTIISDSEMNAALENARNAVNAGVDAIIIQDIGLLGQVRKCFPDMPLHISTQATVTNFQGMALAAELGAVRGVVARELSYDEIKSICAKSKSETEIFVHGAQCYAYSGQCLMSSIYGGRSGNRGKCAGPCRLPYILLNADEEIVDRGYLLSPVDMCLGTEMDKVKDSGAACLKIEGRMKGADYVAATCNIYKKALDEDRPVTESELNVLQNAFSRGGFTAGLFEGKTNRINKSKSNDNAYMGQNEQMLETLRPTFHKESNIRKRSVSLDFTAKAGKAASLVLSCGGETFESISGECVQKAQSAPLTKEHIHKQLIKMGEYPFYVDKINIDADDDIFMPVSAINSMRREVAEGLSKKLTEPYHRNYAAVRAEKITVSKKQGIRFFTAKTETVEQALALAGKDEIKEIYIPQKLIEKNNLKEKFVPFFHAAIREKRIEYYTNRLKTLKNLKINKIAASDWGIIRMAKAEGFEIIGSSDLNVFNSYAVREWQNYGISRIILSPEMSLRQIECIKSEIPLEVMAYGRVQLMKTANCPLFGFGQCGKNRNDWVLKDRKGEKIGIICDCEDCMAYLLNSKPIYMADRLSEIPPAIGINLAFTTESPQECLEIVDKYMHEAEPVPAEYTRGHFYKGVL